MDYLLNDDKSDNNLARKIFIFSNPEIFLLSCPPPCGHFLIQQSTAGGLSYKVKKETRIQISSLFHSHILPYFFKNLRMIGTKLVQTLENWYKA